MSKRSTSFLTLLAIGFVVLEVFAFPHIFSTTSQLTAAQTTPTSTSFSENWGRTRQLEFPTTPTVPQTTTTPSPTSTTSPSTVTSSQSANNVTNNWAGYTATGSTYSAVSGTWKVPEVSTADSESADATWIGIGGVSSDDLIQTGTQNIIGADGQVATSAFIEMLPDNSVTVPDVTVAAGDSVTASIAEASSGEWAITLTDNTNGQSYTTTVAYNSSESSAEWIEEDPSDGIGEIPFDNFGTVSFTGGSVTANGTAESISASGAQAVSMINDEDQTLAAASSLGSDGSSFSVSRTDASSSSGDTSLPGGWRRRGSGIGRDFSSERYYR